MKKESLYTELSEAVQSLLKLARESSYNNISDNCFFIILETKHDYINSFERNILRKIENKRKKAKTLLKITDELEFLYPNIYDVHLYIYKAKKNSTIIEIEYSPRSSSISDNNKDIQPQEPRIYCQVPIPIYSYYKKDKFDINWQLNTVNHKWRMFLWKLKNK